LQKSPDDLVAPLGRGALTRRRLIQGLIAVLGPAAVTVRTRAADALQQSTANDAEPYGPETIPSGVRSRFVNNVNGLRMHVLEAGFEVQDRPAILLLHGFPELAYSWRKVMLPIASGGFHVIAPDRRGYGRTSGWDVGYDDDIDAFGTLNQVRDMLGLVSALGYRSVAAVIGHDQGSPIAAWGAVVRPDVFRSVVMMSSPFAGPPTLPFNTADTTQGDAALDHIYEDLAALNPPRKYYQQYYTTRPANDDIWHPAQGVHAFLRAYYHMKSADWKQNVPFPLKARTASEWAKLPRYYVMDLDKGMRRPWPRKCHRRPRSPRANGSPKLSLGSTARNMRGLGSRADLTAIASDGTVKTPRSCDCSPAERSTFRRFLSVGRVTGASIKRPETLRKCRRRRARGCWGRI
jgi:pimeloyl-ACP methyl ester carboxylesterase